MHVNENIRLMIETKPKSRAIKHLLSALWCIATQLDTVTCRLVHSISRLTAVCWLLHIYTGSLRVVMHP